MQVAFVTNSSSMSRDRIVKTLADVGVEARSLEVASAGLATAQYLKARFRRFKMLFIGQRGFRGIIDEVCADAIAEQAEDEVVVVGRDPELTPAKLARAGEAARRGAALVATSRDPFFPTGNDLQPGPAATVLQLEQAMGCKAYMVGKPNPFLLESVLNLDDAQRRASLIVGDSVEFDVGLGVAVGATTALLTRSEQPPSNDLQPDWVIQRLDQILPLLAVNQ
jgi:HAD superfamily hydrolase (TIGR01450 family)